jgi:hypothetical protein
MPIDVSPFIATLQAIDVSVCEDGNCDCIFVFGETGPQSDYPAILAPVTEGSNLQT